MHLLGGSVLKNFRLLVNSVLLFTVPAIALAPQGNPIQVHIQPEKVNQEERQVENAYTSSYDEIMRLLDGIESGELENRCAPEQLDRLNHYIAFLAKEGVLPDDSEESLSLEDDIDELVNGEENPYEYAFHFGSPGDFMIAPAVFYGSGDVVLCKGWLKKQWKHTKEFCKKHKKAIIVGAAVVVAVAIVVVVVLTYPPAAPSVATAAASAVGAAGESLSASDKSNEERGEEGSFFGPTETPPSMVAAEDVLGLKSALDNQISSFKENIVQQQFFQPIEFSNGPQELSWGENGRTLGALFAHDSLNNLQDQISSDPRLAFEIQEMKSKHASFMLGWNNNGSSEHSEIDRRFSTDYTHLYTDSSLKPDFVTLSYQARGESALAAGYLPQAVKDFGKAIKRDPVNPIPYLERGIAHFGLGQYDRSLEDYREFAAQSQKTYPLVVTDFTLGFIKGLPRGIYDSGEGLFLLFSDLVRHPVHTGVQMYEALSLLAGLVRTAQWDALGKALAPEIRQLVQEWNTIPSDKRGELAGYAFGKYGADIVIPGALAKIVEKGVQGGRELGRIYKSLQTAEKTLLLESVAGLESGAKIGEVVRASQRTIKLGEELGYSAHEMTQLKVVGELEGIVTKNFESIANNPSMCQSFQRFEYAKEFLKPYSGKFMSEIQAKELIRQSGIPTFPRPNGIPESFRVKLSEKPGGIKYIHPDHTYESIRVMPGKPHSPNPHQQKPYVVHMMDGKALDKYGNPVINSSVPEAHIPLEEFVYRKQ